MAAHARRGHERRTDPTPPAGSGFQPEERPPFSQPAIWGFVISCLSLFVFGFIGAAGFLYWVIVFLLSHFG